MKTSKFVQRSLIEKPVVLERVNMFMFKLGRFTGRRTWSNAPDGFAGAPSHTSYMLEYEETGEMWFYNEKCNVLGTRHP